MDGEGSINLSDLLVVLGIKSEDEAAKFVAEEVTNVEFSDPELVKVTRKGKTLGLFGKADWLLESLKPFDTEETLTISLKDGGEIVVKVTDETYSNLSDFITDARLTVDGKTYGKGDTWTVRPDVDYDLKLYFNEAGSRQFPVGGSEMVMDLVPGMTLSPNTQGTFSIPFGDAGTLSGNRWFVGDDNKLHIVFADDPDDLLTRSSKTRFEVDLFASFDGTENNIEFNDRVNRNVEINNDTDASISKKGSYNPETGKMEYTLTVKSEGKSENIKVTDVIHGNMLTLDQNSITIDPNKELNGGINKSDKGFDLTIKNMSHNETVTIKYTASVDYSKVGPDGTVTAEDGKNTVKVETNGKQQSDEVITNTIKFSDITKTNTKSTDNGDTVELEWLIVANSNQRGSIVGAKIKDQIDVNSKDNMHYAVGEDGKLKLNVVIKDGDIVVDTRTEYVDVTTAYNDGPQTWTYTVPKVTAENENYTYEISYSTIAQKKAESKTVKNNTENEGGGTSSGSGVVPGTGGGGEPEKFVCAKSAKAVTEKYIDWDIIINVPEEGFPDGLTVIDEIPTLYGTFADKFVEIRDVTGLLEGEDYTNPPAVERTPIDTPNKQKEKVTIEFYQDKQHQKKGLKAGARTVTITIRTENDQDWIKAAMEMPGGDPRYIHTNIVHVNEITKDATGIPLNSSLEKSNTQADKGDIPVATVDGLPVYEYSVTVTNVTELPLEIEDTFDTDELEYYGLGNQYNGWQYIAAASQKNNLNAGTAPYHAQITQTDKGITITANDLPKKLDGSFYEYYRIYYRLKVKDNTALEAIKQQALLNDGVYKIHNSAEWNDIPDEYDVKYEVPVLKKTGAFVGELGTSKERQYNFEIEINADSLMVNGGEPMTLTDTHTKNLSVDYHSVKVYKLPKGVTSKSDQYIDNTVVWNFEGNSGEFTLEDEAHYVITYNALVVGSGNQEFSNEVEMNGFHASKSDKRDFGGSASGEGIIYQIKLIKHKNGQTSEGLEGATFQLFKDDGNGGKEPMKWGKDNSLGRAGENITFTTDNTGYVLIALNQSIHGNELEGGVHYYLKEIETPPGYELRDDSPEYWEFTLTTDPDEVNYGDDDRRDENGRRQWIYYYYNDVLRMANVPAEEPITVNVNKLWLKADGTPIEDDELKDLIAKVQLMRKTNNGEYEKVKVTYEDGQPVVTTVTGTEGEVNLSKENNWEYSWPDLPRVTEDGTKYAYKIEEVSVDGFVASVSETETETTKTYSLKNYQLPPDDLFTNLTVKKVWQNESGDQLEAPQDTIQFHLYRVMSLQPFEVQPTSGGELYNAEGMDSYKVPSDEWSSDEFGEGYYQLRKNDNWQLKFNNLPAVVINKENNVATYYAYYVKEDPVGSFKATYSTETTDDGISKVITNMPEGSYMNLNIEKKWKKGEEIITPPEGSYATFDIHRMKSECTVLPLQHPVTVKWGDGSELIADVGDQLTVYAKKAEGTGQYEGANIYWPGGNQYVQSDTTINLQIPANYSGNEYKIYTDNHDMVFISNVIDKTERKKEYGEAKYDGLIKTITLSGENSWKEYVKNLIRVDKDGNVYSYYVTEKECSPTAIETIFTDDIGNGPQHTIGGDADIEVTNKVEEQSGSLKLTKSVKVNKNDPVDDAEKNLVNGKYIFKVESGEGIAPAVTKYVEITVLNGVATSYKVAPSAEALEGATPITGNTAIVGDLQEGDYTITETNKNGLQLTGIVRGDGNTSAVDLKNDKVTVHVTAGEDNPGESTAAVAEFTNNIDAVKAKVVKVWDDNGNSNRPRSLRVTLSNGTEVTLPDANGKWEATITGLPKYDSITGQEIEYSWTEEALPSGYYLSNYKEEKDGTTGVITSTLTNSISDNYNPLTNIKGKKIWDDGGREDRPDSITVILKNGSEEVARQTVSKPTAEDANKDQWPFEFTNLPVFNEDGSIIQYTVEEVLPEGYSSVYGIKVEFEQATYIAGDVTGTIVNSYTPDTEICRETDLGYIVIRHGQDYVVWTPRPLQDGELDKIKTKVKTLSDQFSGIDNPHSIRYINGVPSSVGVGSKPNATVKMVNGTVWVHFDKASSQSDIAYGKIPYTYTSVGGEGGGSITNTSKLTDFKFSKKWLGNSSQEIDWDRDIQVTVFRRIGETKDESFSLVYDITKNAVLNPVEGRVEFTAKGGTETTPKLVLTIVEENGKKYYNFKLNNLDYSDESGGKYTYYVVETNEQLEFYKAPAYSNTSAPTGATEAYDGGTIINRMEGGVVLPSTGGPGTKLFYGLGISFVGFAGLLLFIKRRELRDLSKRRW